MRRSIEKVRRIDDPRTAGFAGEKRRDRETQAIERAGRDERGQHARSAFDEERPNAQTLQRSQHRVGFERLEFMNLRIGHVAQRRQRGGRSQDDRADAAVEKSRLRIQIPGLCHRHTRGRAAARSNAQRRVVGSHRVRSDENGVTRGSGLSHAPHILLV